MEGGALMTSRVKGSCLCEAVTFAVEGRIWGASLCHCGQCRKMSGHVWSSAVTLRDSLSVEGDVTWYESSDTARRGFCAVCGSSLFWSHRDESSISFALGALDETAGLTLEKHIFVSDKGDYYEIGDDLPQHAQ